MSTHPALASQPEWMAWLAASDELGKRRDSLNRQILKAQADRDQIIETRNSRNAEAVRRGKPVPVFDPLPKYHSSEKNSKYYRSAADIFRQGFQMPEDVRIEVLL